MTDYTIWVLEYSYVPDNPLSGVIYGAHNQGTRRVPYCYAVIKGRGHLIMVDVGHNNAGWGRTFAGTMNCQGWQSAAEILGRVDLRPDQVDTVVLTHMHFDHAGNLDAFPNAQVYLQEQELTKNVWAMTLPPRLSLLSHGVDPGDVLKCVELGRAGRLHLIDGDREDLLPGIDVHAAFDTHTFASMYVVIRNDGTRHSADRWVLCGDLVYVYENLGADGSTVPKDRYAPVGFATGSQGNLVLATEAMVSMVGGDIRRVIPVHEDRLHRHFPSQTWNDGLRITEICLADGERSRLA